MLPPRDQVEQRGLRGIQETREEEEGTSGRPGRAPQFHVLIDFYTQNL